MTAGLSRPLARIGFGQAAVNELDHRHRAQARDEIPSSHRRSSAQFRGAYRDLG